MYLAGAAASRQPLCFGLRRRSSYRLPVMSSPCGRALAKSCAGCSRSHISGLLPKCFRRQSRRPLLQPLRPWEAVAASAWRSPLSGRYVCPKRQMSKISRRTTRTACSPCTWPSSGRLLRATSRKCCRSREAAHEVTRGCDFRTSREQGRGASNMA